VLAVAGVIDSFLYVGSAMATTAIGTTSVEPGCHAERRGRSEQLLSGRTVPFLESATREVREVRVVQLLECEPELGDGLSAEDRAIASRSLPVHAAVLKKGDWSPGAQPSEAGCLGYLIAKGLLIRRVEVTPGTSVELLGRGDLLRPWQEDTSSFCTASWEVLEQTTLVALGPGLTRSLGQWPAIASNVAARGLRRSRALAADAAISSIIGIEERLLLLLWHIAERWGETGKDGIRISIRLPHRLLAEMVGARRPSVTTALAELQEAGHLYSTSNSRWVLRGDPPC
jgi:CRP/FNR family transcriptional regulator, cyclic AMP receptor protein